MARYSYTVQDSKGEASSGAIEANDENEAISTLQAKGYFILAISTDKASSGGAKSGGGASVALRDLVFFAEQLATLLNGGVPLVRALSLLGDNSSSKGLQYALAQVTKDVASGTALYKALEKHPKVKDVAVIGVPDLIKGQAVMAVIALKEGLEGSREEFLKYCKDNMPDYRVPKTILFRQEIPRNPAGKIQKKVLRQEVQTV